MTPDEQPVIPQSRFLAGPRKWAILIVGMTVLGAVIFSLLRGNQSNQTSSTTTTESIGSTNGSPNRSRTFQQVTVPLVADADKDGLPDQRETELKTNPRLADSDGDDASDYDEVEVWKTDPLKQDTDGDGFNDGEEIRTGNNPIGSGSLRNLQQTISNINGQ